MNVKKFLNKSMAFRHGLRKLRLKYMQPQWNKLIDDDPSYWANAVESASGPNILVATSVGAHLPSVTTESTLAAALTLRGAKVHILLCDGILPACLDCTYGITLLDKVLAECGPQKDLCASCFEHTSQMFESLGIKIHRYSDWISEEERCEAQRLAREVPVNEIEDFTYDNLAVGEHAFAGALRFYSKGSLDDEPLAEPVLRRYLQASLLTTFAMQNLLKAHTFVSAVFHHGIYVPQGLIGEVCRSNNVPVVNWNVAYRKSCFIFSHADTYHHTLMDEPASNWEHIQWNDVCEDEIMHYLKSRWYGKQDWIWFHENPQENVQKIAAEIGIDFSKPCIGMLTNVMWDAQLHYPANAFPDMLTWVLNTISYFAKRPDLQLLIRVHPAEIWGGNPSRQKVVDEIHKKFPILPSNVFVVPPEARISTYAAMLQCNPVIIYGTKMGVELTSMGKPVIIAGEAWIRNKGLTMDAASESHYYTLLDALPLEKGLDTDSTECARKYAFHFFFRRMIPLECMIPLKGWPLFKLNLSSMRELEPGTYQGLDVICEGILNGTEFIYPYETVGVSPQLCTV